MSKLVARYPVITGQARVTASEPRIPSANLIDLSPCSHDPLAYRRQSGLLAELGEPVRPGLRMATHHAQPYAFVSSAQAAQRTGEAIATDVTLPDLRNEPVHVTTEIYRNQYKFLVLMWIPRRELLQRRRIIAPRAAATR